MLFECCSNVVRMLFECCSNDVLIYEKLFYILLSLNVYGCQLNGAIKIARRGEAIVVNMRTTEIKTVQTKRFASVPV